MALVIDWQKRLGYKRDPFKTSIYEPVRKFIVGIAPLQEKLSLFLIKTDSFGTISGDKGTGKTTFLLWIRREVAGRDGFRCKYVDARKAKNLEQFVELLNLKKGGIKGLLRKFGVADASLPEKEEKILSIYKKHKHLLLVDNSGALDKESLEFLEKLIKETECQVICADTSEKLINMALREPFTDKLKIRMPQYAKADLIRLLQRRVELVAGSAGVFPFTKDSLEPLAKHAGANPSRFLESAKEEAIKLSLKVTKKPKRVKRTAEIKKPVNTEKKAGFFQIKIERGPEPKKKEEQKVKAPTPPGDSAGPISKETLQEAEELSTVLEAPAQDAAPDEIIISDHEEPKEEIVVEDTKPKKTRKTKFDNVVAEVVGGEPAKPKKKPAKRSKKAPARKSPKRSKK